MSVLGIIATAGRWVAEEEHLYTDADGNVVTHSPLLPETAEIIWGGLASVIIFAAIYKFGWPVMKKSFAARTEKIQKELDAAAADTSSAAVDHVVTGSLDDATQQELIENFISRVGASA